MLDRQKVCDILLSQQENAWTFFENGSDNYFEHRDRMYAVTKNLQIWRKYGEKIPEELIGEIEKLVKNYGCNLETN